MREIDGVLHDVALFLQGRSDVHRGIRDQERPRIRRHIHEIDVAEPPLRAQSCVGRDHRVHQFVRMQRAFHQQRRLAGAHQGDSLCRRFVAV